MMNLTFIDFNIYLNKQTRYVNTESFVDLMAVYKLWCAIMKSKLLYFSPLKFHKHELADSSLISSGLKGLNLTQTTL